jgi:hypothetical protein
MTLHHAFEVADFKLQCVYCSERLDESSWESVHEGTILYKTLSCPRCSRSLMVPLTTLGSGHDNWDGKHSWTTSQGVSIVKSKEKMRNLESRIKIISEKTHP